MLTRFKLQGLAFGVLGMMIFTAAAACGGDEAPPTLEPGSGALVELEFSSPEFGHMEDIPERFTCDGVNESPRLELGRIPEGTQSLAIVVDDPDAPDGIFNHWVVYDLPIDVAELGRGQPSAETLEVGGTQGTNDAGSIGWTGPCPPEGQAHQYDFYLYALQSELGLEPGAKRDEVAMAMREAGVIGVGTFSGLYARP